MNVGGREHFALAVDASNLVRDRRGMGRIARGVLRSAADGGDVTVTLLADKRGDRLALGGEFSFPIERTKSARRRNAYDTVWYPFNGMRFPACAPTLVSVHDVFAFTFPHRSAVARFREQAPMRRAARLATRILADSMWARGEIVRELRVAPERVAIVIPSPDSFWFPYAGDALSSQLENKRYVLLVGAREERKNARLALEACARALRAPHEILVIVGELGAQDRAFARGRGVPLAEISASDAMLRALYRNAEIVLVPSLAEGFGLIAVEAMACGAAVVAARASALPEATGGAAILLDPRDPALWAGAIRTVLDEPARLAALRERAGARFAGADRSASARATVGLLRELARREDRLGP